MKNGQDRSAIPGLFSSCLVLLATLALGGCMPKQFQVRAGTDPQYLDDDVRFKTTYYFRVFDYCGELTEPPHRPKILSDSLYRFRMTGKANSLTNKVRFESGTLRAEELDPFGAGVEFDAATNTFRFQSKQHGEAEAAREQAFDEIRGLVEVYESTLKAFDDSDNSYRSATRRLIQQRLDRLNYVGATVDHSERTNVSSKKSESGYGARDPGAEAKAIFILEPPRASADSTVPGYCLGNQLRRGYQIFGPEGWRTFDQDERLILAMSSSGQPLIDTLRELSDRVLAEKGKGTVPLAPLFREQLRTREAQKALDRTGESLQTRLKSALQAFEQ